MLNNLLFVAFAFIVLLGTLFPLLYEAWRGQQVTVGSPYFDTMALPIGIALLFLMAVGPVLPWRKTNAATVSERLLLPAACAVAVVVACVVAGVRGLAPLSRWARGVRSSGQPASAPALLCSFQKAGRRCLARDWQERQTAG